MTNAAKLLTIVVYASVIGASAWPSQEVASAWTSLTFEIPVPQPYETAKVTATVRGHEPATVLNSLRIKYGGVTVEVPRAVLARFPHPLLHTMNLYHPPGLSTDGYRLTLSFDFGEPSSDVPYDLPTANITICDGRIDDVWVTEATARDSATVEQTKAP